MPSTRLDDLVEFYSILDRLSDRLAGPRTLSSVNSRMGWPREAIYFFYEPGEKRKTGPGLRVTRVGESLNLWNRLQRHRGRADGTEPKPAQWVSSFRGDIIDAWNRLPYSDPRYHVSSFALISQMPFLWLAVPELPKYPNTRFFIEGNAVALLSNRHADTPLDPPSKRWLGNLSPKAAIRESGLWNHEHVNYHHDPSFLPLLRKLVGAT